MHFFGPLSCIFSYNKQDDLNFFLNLYPIRLVLHKIQDFQKSCLGLVLLSRQDQDKTVILKIKIKTRSKMSRPRQDKISSKISRNLVKSLENIGVHFFLRTSSKKRINKCEDNIILYYKKNVNIINFLMASDLADFVFSLKLMQLLKIAAQLRHLTLECTKDRVPLWTILEKFSLFLSTKLKYFDSLVLGALIDRILTR